MITSRCDQQGCSRRRQAGFSLVELVVAIALTAIVVGFSTLFITAPVDAYYTQNRRVGLNNTSDAAKRSLAADLARALPNSVRISITPTRAIIEMLRVEEVAFYRGNGSVGDPARELDIGLVGPVDQQFASLGRFGDGPRPLDLEPNFRLVVNNRGAPAPGTTGRSAYQQTNVITPSITRIRLEDSGDDGEDRVILTPGFRFRSDSPTSRVFLVSGPVAYICNSAANARTLRRYENYAITAAIPASEAAAQLTAIGVSNSVIARDVSACSLRCAPGSPATRCLDTLVVDISFAAPAAATEATRLFVQLPVVNQP